MKRPKTTTLVIASLVLTVGVAVGGYYLIQKRANEIGTIVVPELSAEARRGEIAFQNYCMVCHGENARGTDKGPPLLNRIYSPSHHSNVSFSRAVTLGARQHHWLFGDMPPLPQVGRENIDLIIIYMRELQKANGIL